MYFDYEPMNEDEAQKARFTLLEPGIYNFKVIEAIAKPSSKGNPMIELLLKIKDKEGVEHTVKDFLVATRGMIWKIKHFCDTVGLQKEYEAKIFNAELCLRKIGKANIIFQKGNMKKDGTYFPDKNVVLDYVITDDVIINTIPVSSPVEFSDDIPF